MSGESDWVDLLRPSIEKSLSAKSLSVETSFQLAYALNIRGHKKKPAGKSTLDLAEYDSRSYATDLLIAEEDDTNWIPRVVVEFKLTRVTTHDLLTYSAKAATHKALYPHLRYGIVIGRKALLSPKLLWHGQNFDFMLALPTEATAGADHRKLCALLRDEVEASRTMSRLLARQTKVALIHRKLVISRNR